MILNSLSAFHKQAEADFNEKRNEIVVNFEDNKYEIKIPSDDAPDGFWLSTLMFKHGQCDFASCNCFDEDYCEHLMVALLSTLDKTGSCFLHIKFRQSFWYQLFFTCFSEKGVYQDVGNHTFTLTSSSLSITLQLDPKLFNLLFQPDGHTHSTKDSLFNQSYMYQLAKYLFLLCERGAILQINPDVHQLPSIFSLKNRGTVFHAQVTDKTTLEQLFPAIDFEQTSILPKDLSFVVSSTHVDVDLACLHFDYSPVIPASLLQYESISIGGIPYIPNQNIVIVPTQSYSVPIASLFLLSDHIKQLLSTSCDIEISQKIHYTIECLRDASFSFKAYLHQPGDLKHAHFFAPHYCYIPGEKLISIRNFLSKGLSFTIKATEMGEFLNVHGNQIKEVGFQTHKDACPDIQLNYNVSPNGVLFFDYETGMRYDDWIYYPGKGFFLYTRNPQGIQDGSNVHPENIPMFIDENEEILRKIPHFFAPHAPLKNIVFHVHPTQENGLQLIPIFEGLEQENCRLFGPFLYREHIGFNRLPEHLQPLSTIPLTVHTSDVPNFISKYAQHKHILFVHPETRSPKTLELSVLSIKRPFPSSPLHLELELHTDIGSLPLGDLLKQLTHKHLFLFSKAGFLNFQLYFFQLLRSFILNDHWIINTNTLIVSVTDIFKLDALAPLSLSVNVQAAPEDRNFFEQLKVLCLPSIPHELFSTNHNLRHYQSTGLLWLWGLYNYRLSGLLCDEMGLGKTHQATALLDIVYQSTRQSSEKTIFLVVSPASVLPHWEQILASHLSKDVRIFSFYGVNKPKELPPYDIIITSYGTLRQKQHLFLNQTFTVAIFDEMHVAKNKTSQIHKILSRLDAQMKVGLTGTPVENNLLEFKSLFDIILPNYLPSDSDFKKKQWPKTKEDGSGLHDTLIKMTRPFILRRTKKNVLPELPDKVESIIHCSLSPEQEQLYLATLQREKNHVQQLFNIDNNQVNYLHIFALLNHLKQICDHPAVFFKQPKDYHKYTSGKWEAFKELLHDSLNSGYKVVVFSQYIHMMNIIALYLEEVGIKYAAIQGKSVKRQEEIEKFTHDPNCRVFIGSLLAAGTGINLTAGNVVIMYDRWWNPAKENQALDRAHRIGQKRTVFVYKFITESTIEERIQYLITKKTQLIHDTITSQDADILHTFNAEDLRIILSYQDEQIQSEDC